MVYNFINFVYILIEYELYILCWKYNNRIIIINFCSKIVFLYFNDIFVILL